MNSPDIMQQAIQILDNWDEQSEKALLQQLQAEMTTIQSSVLGESTNKIQDALLHYYEKIRVRRILLMQLQKQRDTPCTRLVDMYALKVLNSAAMIPNLGLSSPEGYVNSAQGRRDLLVDLLRTVNHDLSIHWIQIHGDDPNGLYPVPLADNYTPISGYEGCQDNELIALINQYEQLVVFMREGDNRLIQILSEVFSGLHQFLEAWVRDPIAASAGTLAGILEGLGLYFLYDALDWAVGLIPSLVIFGEPPKFGETRGRAADAFWNAVESLGGSDSRNNPNYQQVRGGGQTIGQLIALANAVKAAYEFTHAVSGLGGPPSGGIALNTGGTATLSWGTVVAQADAVPWVKGAEIANGVRAALAFFNNQGQRGRGALDPDDLTGIFSKDHEMHEGKWRCWELALGWPEGEIQNMSQAIEKLRPVVDGIIEYSRFAGTWTFDDRIPQFVFRQTMSSGIQVHIEVRMNWSDFKGEITGSLFYDEYDGDIRCR